MKEVIYLLARFDLFPPFYIANLRMSNIKKFLMQRSLVSLARALVKNAKIIILDEATGWFQNVAI